MPARVLSIFLILAMAPVPALAQSGEWDAAGAHYGADEMAEARRQLQESHGGQRYLFLEAERLEFRTNEGDGLFLWDAQGWYGGDINKLWVKAEGEYGFEVDAFEGAEVQALYSRAISAFFDLQAGIRHDFEPDPSRTHAVIGLQGLAPHWFEVDFAAFLSDEGDLTARLEAEYDILFTQRLILQPRAELALSAQDVPELGVGSGLSSAELGLRLRYEFTRKFAPYIGLSWERAVGDTADFTRLAGKPVDSLSFLFGLRLWY